MVGSAGSDLSMRLSSKDERVKSDLIKEDPSVLLFDAPCVEGRTCGLF